MPPRYFKKHVAVATNAARYPRPLPNSENQIDPLEITDALERRITGWPQAYIPESFKVFLDTCNQHIPSLYFRPWPYQIKLFALLFRAWFERRDAVAKQTRQSGKTDPTARWLGYMVIREGIQCVILSTKTTKTRKLTRIIQRIMKAEGSPLIAEGIDETRFADNSGYVAMSGKKEAQRESDTADIVLIDESQDIPFSPTFADVSPMRSGTNGILVALGIGGLQSSEEDRASLITTMQDRPGILRLDVTGPGILKERPAYANTMEKDKEVMLPHEYRANYLLEDYPATGTSLMPVILRYEDVYPGKTFDVRDVSRETELSVGIDWGKRNDSSALVGAALTRQRSPVSGRAEIVQCVLYRYAWFGAIGYKQQLKEIIAILKDTEYDFLRPELNHVGQVMCEMLYDECAEAGLLSDPSNPNVISQKIWKPVYAMRDDNTDAHKAMSTLSYCNAILYSEDSSGFATRCVTNLKGVGAIYSLQNDVRTTHSDWLAGFRAAIYPERDARRRDAG